MKKKNVTMFNTAKIFGTLSEGHPKVDRWISRELAFASGDAVLLPFQVEKRHLKNVLTCMRLMDVMGLLVKGDLRKDIVRYVPLLDKVAKRANSVDTIIRSKSSFKGFNAIGIALLQLLKDTKVNVNSISNAFIAGKSPFINSIKGALLAEGAKVQRVSNASQITVPNKGRSMGIAVIGNMNAASTKRIISIIKDNWDKLIVIDLRKSAHVKSMGFGAPCLKLPDLIKKSRTISVELLTRAVKK